MKSSKIVSLVSIIITLAVVLFIHLIIFLSNNSVIDVEKINLARMDTLVYSHKNEKFIFSSSLKENNILHYTIGGYKRQYFYKDPSFGDEKPWQDLQFKHTYDISNIKPKTDNLPEVSEMSNAQLQKLTGKDRFSDGEYNNMRTVYIWDDEYVFIPYEYGYGFGYYYNLKSEDKAEVMSPTEYDSYVKGILGGETLPEIFITENQALCVLYKKYNNLYIRVLN